MTEQQWLKLEDIDEMWAFAWPDAGARKNRLFACALARQFGGEMSASELEILAKAESKEDGAVSYAELAAAIRSNPRGATPQRVALILGVGADLASDAGFTAISAAVDGATNYRDRMERSKKCCEWLHEVVGYPGWQLNRSQLRDEEEGGLWRKSEDDGLELQVVPPSVLYWEDGLIVDMAESIYDEEGWSRMPILGDMLEEAGCDDETLLQHCRGFERCPVNGWRPARHAKGCWAIDWIRGVP